MPLRGVLLGAIGSAVCGCSVLISPADGPSPDCPAAISGSGYGACLVTGNGDLYCWGDTRTNGTGSGLDELRPARVDLDDVHAVAVGEGHACAIHGDDRIVSCWGVNDRGQVGDMTMELRRVPTEVMGLRDIAVVRPGETHTCAVDMAGMLWCWGGNELGQLGDTAGAPRAMPLPVTSLTGVTDVAVGDLFTCAIADGVTHCWGNNDVGQLGDASSELSRSDPGPVSFLATSDRVTSSCESHVCAISSRTLNCWGLNTSAQVGDGSTMNAMQPVPVLPQASAASVGGKHTCALNEAQDLYCWGSNYQGQIGVLPELDPVPEPTRLDDLSGGDDPTIEVAAGCISTCALRSSGEVFCWGEGSFGQLGNGTRESSDVPIRVELPCE